MNITDYKTIVFDCDGVILNSNKVKTEAFYMTALPYGKIAAEQLVSYHVANGGISRYEKFTWFVDNILEEQADRVRVIQALIDSYADYVKTALLTCSIAEGLEPLRQASDASWLIVSGGDQKELRELFAQRELSKFFDKGIFGSPDNKDTILAREKQAGNIVFPALFIGDSKYDYEAAMGAGLDFTFLSSWTEFKDFQQFFKDKQVYIFENINSLL